MGGDPPVCCLYILGHSGIGFAADWSWVLSRYFLLPSAVKAEWFVLTNGELFTLGLKAIKMMEMGTFQMPGLPRV